MDARTEPEIVLYDLAFNKNVCFSPVVWRIRLMLNYKIIPYRIIFLEFPDIEPTLKTMSCIGLFSTSRSSLRAPLPSIFYLLRSQYTAKKSPLRADLVPAESASESKIKYTVPTIQHVPSNNFMMDSVTIVQFLDSRCGRWNLPNSVMPREAMLGHRLEDLLLEPEKEEEYRNAVGDRMRVVNDPIRTNKADGPFVLGARPSMTDFLLRAVNEEPFQKMVKFPGYGDISEACLPYMEKAD
ncbi:hypothetical protein BGW36DRAFT_417795 [Talaromyces proteolyticus]|uniref:GST N-terminal domain-containing protein n=1 Tax=Talaromyces proteolyticus TaxID=1131652 RepID=A0AAD4PVP8_9EURO|nr:uncharacterized protein BGW36DRAFT_417795 [Talaromyces proteolyticus]KAH8696755.1 hypothetical protein BGW36DRAFT_417795 [Talaromyces proteolyticus]